MDPELHRDHRVIASLPTNVGVLIIGLVDPHRRASVSLAHTMATGRSVRVSLITRAQLESARGAIDLALAAHDRVDAAQAARAEEASA